MEETEFITDVRNAEYLENGTIRCDVQFEGEMTEEGEALYTPFVASAADFMDYGRQLHADLVAGKYGEVKPFEATPENLEKLRQEKHAEITAWRDAEENREFVFEYDGRRWDCGRASYSRLSPVVEAAKSGVLPERFFWTDADNEDVTMDTSALEKLEQAMRQNMVIQGFKIHERQRQMKAEIAALTTPQDIRAYIPGWKEEA